MSLTSKEWEFLQDVLGAAVAVYKSKASEVQKLYKQKFIEEDYRAAHVYESLSVGYAQKARKLEKLFSKLFFEEDTNL